MVIAGIGGGSRNATAAIVDGGRITGVCAQERATRVRNDGVTASGLPDQALDLLLERRGRTRQDISRYVLVDGDGPPPAVTVDRLDHHRAHACTAYLTSPSSAAAIVVCDHEAPEVSVWIGDGPTVRPVELPWRGDGFVRVFARSSAALGFAPSVVDEQAEALARLAPDSRDAAIDGLMRREDDRLVVDPSLERVVADRLSGGDGVGSLARAALANALQARIADLLVDMLRDVRQATGQADLCLGGSLFYHSSINSRVRQSGLFSRVFVPVDPGNGGLAVGAAQDALGVGPARLSPFLGPSYSAEETKQVLDSCKLQYEWESEEDAVQVAVRALRDGRLVGWFDGSMEWGPRALGARCILANPTAPYVLDNLNRFLKRRAPWRGYALSGTEEALAEHFDGPGTAPFMECDYRPRDPARLREALPSTAAAVRVHTVSADYELPNFRRLLDVVGETTGLPFVINTSFNGFHEPIVCNPRDAVRVFYGTGLDVLVINQFVLRK